MTILDTKEGREALIWALAHAIEIDAGKTFAVLSGLRQGKHIKQTAYDAVSDPAKLAELIASETRRCGVHAWAVKHEYRPICWGVRGSEYGGFWDMPQARAILATLLQLPDAARAQAERVLRGEV
jgi:hypothetical protein